nr:serine hydrolase [Ectobacillus ponti]
MKKLSLLFVGIALILPLYLSFSHTKAPVQASQPEINGRYGVVIDAATGEILYDKNAKRQAPPASLTKLMTALLLLERVGEREEIVITQHAIDTESGAKQVPLEAGERLRRNEALKLMLTISVDSVAESVAEHISGSKKEFAHLMNQRARELGADTLTFYNASGSDALGHRASPYELALIARELLKHPEALDCMSRVTNTVQTSLHTREITNSGRKDLKDDPLALGSKSGRTALADYTLITVDEKQGKRVIVVIMKSERKTLYTDAAKLAAYALH